MAVEALEVQIAGERLLARADRTLHWPSEGVLFAADIHLGKAATYRSLGVPVPKGTTATTLRRLDEALLETRPERLVLLGDLWHAKAGKTEAGILALSEWRAKHGSLSIDLVLGNHDLHAGSLPSDLGISELPESFRCGAFRLCHHPCEHSAGYVLAGHVHPAICLAGKGRQSLTLPCFWFGKGCGLLPAFGEFTGCARISPEPDDCVLAVADGHVLRVR